MPEFTKFGFSAGVMSKRFHMRSDLQQYDLGLSAAENFLVDFAGGLVTRPGMEFLEYVQDMNEPVRIVKFQFNNLTSNTYLIVFSKDRIRFMQDGTYVLEAAKTITSATSTTVTLAAHGYANADWVKINGETYEITAATTNTFNLIDVFGDTVNPAAFAGVSVARIYTLLSVYLPADLKKLKFSQHRDTLYINSVDYTERKLVRNDHADWDLYRTIVEPITNFSPTGLVVTPDAAGSAGVAYAVTAIDFTGKESPVDPTGMILNRACINFTVTSGSVKLTWTAPAVPVKKYRIYRTQVTRLGADIHFGFTFGFIGESLTTQFTDNNIVPDFTKVLMEEENPFALRNIDQISVTAGGTGYNDNTTTVIVTGAPGHDFTGKPIIIGGVIKGIRILTRGVEYVSPVVTFPTGGGTGATATATVASALGASPNCSIMAQQRRVRFGPSASPGLVAGSRIAEYDSYRTSGIGLATDPYLVVLDSERPTPILNAMASPEGMFVFQNTGIAQIRGVDDGVISPNSIRQHVISNEGAADVQPQAVGREFLYITASYDAFAMIQPTNLPTYYTTKDISIFSDDYFTEENKVVAFDWARSPDRIIWAVREDGSFLAGTYNVDQEVSAWIKQTTFGKVEDVVVLEEDNKSNTYFVVQRTYNPTNNDLFDFIPKRYIERIKPHSGKTPEDFPNLDCYEQTTPTVQTFPMWLAVNGPPNYTTGLTPYVLHSEANFVSGDVGKVVRAGKFRGVVSVFLNSSTILVNADRMFEPGFGESLNRGLPSEPYFEANTWSMTAPFSSLQGLKRFIGWGFGLKLNGAASTTVSTTDGTLAISPTTHAAVGYGYTASFTTLYLTANDVSIEGKKKSIKSIRVRLVDSENRNIQFKAVDGTSEYPLSNRRENTLFDDAGLKDGMFDISLDGGIDFGGQISGEVTGGVQVSLIGYSAEVDIEP